MQILVNGNPIYFPKSLTILDLLISINIQRNGTAVALNNKIIPQSQFEVMLIEENDKVEIIRAVGGG